MVLGMMPVALGVGEGSDIRSPMGVTVIGGLLTSLFLTLAVVPAAYDLFDEWKDRINARTGRASPAGPDEQAREGGDEDLELRGV
jgi:hypothetical protein